MSNSILFVCLGNICRSPAAEGILKHISKERSLDLYVASCGLGEWHVGELPDRRMRQAAKNRGIILDSRAQSFKASFFEDFDYIMAADQEVLETLRSWTKNTKKLHLITHFSNKYKGKDIPDPYYGDGAGFEHVLDMLEESCEALIKHLS